MASRKDFKILKKEIAVSGRCPKAVLNPPEHGGNIATITGEVASRQDLEWIQEFARRHGFLLLAQHLSVP